MESVAFGGETSQRGWNRGSEREIDNFGEHISLRFPLQLQHHIGIMDFFRLHSKIIQCLPLARMIEHLHECGNPGIQLSPLHGSECLS